MSETAIEATAAQVDRGRHPGSPGVELRMDEASELLWGVGAVAERVGVATPTLRTWERRYGIGPSRRTEGGHRRYSEVDIRRVQLMNRIVTSGVAAQSAARVALALDESGLVAALASDDPTYSTPGHVIATPAESVQRIVSGAYDLDVVGLAEALRLSTEDWGVLGAWVNVFRPAMRALSEGVADKSVGVESRRLAYERMKTELRSVTHRYAPRYLGNRPLVLASLDHEGDSLGVLAIEAALAGRGIAVLALGFATATGDINALAARARPSALYLWATEDANHVLCDLRAPKGPLPVLLGGEGWGEPAETDPSLEPEHAPDVLATVDRLLDLMRVADAAD